MPTFLYSGKFWLKSLAYVTGIILVLIVTGQLLLLFLFSDLQVRTAVNQAFAKSGYVVHFDERIRRSWFPAPNINLYQVRLEPESSGYSPVFTAERVNIRLSYASLFGEVKVAKLTLIHPVFNAVHLNDGSWNTDAFFTARKRQDALLERVAVRGGTVNLLDEKTAKTYSFTAIDADCNEMQGDAALHLQLQLTQGFAYTPTLTLDTHILRHDNGYILQNVSGSLLAQLPYIGEVQAHWQTPLIRWQNNVYLLDTGEWEVTGNGAWNRLSFHLKSSAWNANIQGDRVQIPSIRAVAHWNDGSASWDSNLILDNIVRQGQSVQLGMAKYELTRKTAQYIQMINAGGEAEADLDKASLSLQNAFIHTIQTEAGGTHPLWQTEIAGKIHYVYGQFLDADLTGTFDKQPLHLLVHHSAADGHGLWTADIRTQALNLTPYLDAVDHLVSAPQKLNAAFSVGEKLLRRLDNAAIQALVQIDHLNIDGWQMDAFSGAAYADHHGISWEKIHANMYGGTIEGSLKMSNSTPRSYHIEQTLHNINVRDWLSDWMDYSHLDGTANAVINLSLYGNSVPELLVSMSGNTLVNINNGTMRGIDITDLLKNHDNLVKNLSENAINFNRHNQTQFRFFTVQTRWVNGIGYTPQVAFDSNRLNVSGQGKFDSKDKTLDYSLSVIGSLPTSGKNTMLNLPLRITGSPEHPVYALDYAAITNNMQHQQEKQDAVKNILQQQWQLLQ